MKSSSRSLVIAVLALLAVAAAVLSWRSLNRADTLPALAYTALDGTAANTEQLRGKVLLINFWATSCTTCVREMPHIVETHQKYKDRGFDTLAIAMSYDPPAYVSQFAHSRGLPFTVAIDNTGQLAKTLGDVKLTPTTYLVNKRGEIVKRYVGEPDFAALHALVEQLLAES